MTSSERLAEEQNAPSACAKCRAQQPHLLFQRTLRMLPWTNKEISKSTSEQQKKPPNTPQKGAPETIPKQGSLPIPAQAEQKTNFADWILRQIGQRHPKRIPRKAPRTPPAATRRFQGASKRCLGSEDVENVIVDRCIVRNHCF